MASRFSRFRFAAAAAVSFSAGVVFASGMNWTKISWAQGGTTSRSASVRGPMAPEGSSFADIAERVTPGVVAVNTTRTARPRPQARGRAPQGMEDFLEQFGPQQPRQQRGEGSGFIVTQDGYIVTNNHVVADADQVSITLSDGRTFKAKVIGSDSTTDVAVVKIDAKGLPTLAIGNDETTRIGDWVLAVGNPLGLDFTVTAGIISAKGRGSEIQLPNAGNFTISDFIQTDAAINPGNSGGPLINLRGEVIGLNSAIASQTGFYSGYGFAIPITLVKAVTDDLIKEGRVRLPVMGVSVGRIDPEDAGINGLARVAGVKVAGFNPADGGPAKAAGIEVGDIIITVDGKPVDRVSSLQRVVRSRRVNDVVPVEVMRFGTKKSFKVKLVEAEALSRVAALPEAAAKAVPAAGKLGITVEAIPADVSERMKLDGRGVRVSNVAEDGPARDKLAAGSDIVLEVLYPTPRRAVKTVNDLQGVLSGLKDGDYVSLLVQNMDPRVGQRVVNIRVGG
ncbi:trypsin-like peptidase domain-containing protein [Gemmatimonas sp.]|uniref:trypsin-like peptidase domain-containing protein n=1 Tax=Gemmatimonas sp. TaxID=1962908 RepID=UPI00286AD897|nr:trypsin-like peptidase domain-containing protein [Gemmatimonas sp.]